MKGIVDRIEDGIVVIEFNDKTQDFPISLVAQDVQEGDVVKEVDGVWVKDKEATAERAKHIQQLMDRLWAD